MRAWAWCSVLWVAGCWGAHDGIDAGPDAPPHDVGLDARGSPRPDVPRDVPPDHPDAPPILVEAGLDAPIVGPVAAVGEGRSFEVELAVRYETPGVRLPAVLRATLWLAEAGGESVAVPAMAGAARRVVVARAPDEPWQVDFGRRGFASVGECVPILELFASTVVTPIDDDGDGLADRLSGEGTGHLTEMLSDAFFVEHAFRATVRGWVETDPSRLGWETPYPDHTPLSGSTVALQASEPFVPPSSAWLEDGAARVELEAMGFDGVAMGFRLPTVLPLDAHLVLRTDAPLVGVDGLPVALPPALDTVPLARALPRVDFEDPSVFHVEGSARAVAGIGSVGPIGGARSVLVEAPPPFGRGDGGLLVTRLAVGPTDTRVRVRLRYVFRAPSMPAAGEAYPIYLALMGAGWPGRGPVATAMTPTGDATFPWVSDVVEAELALTGGDSEVLVVVGERWPCFGMFPSTLAYDVLVDDVRAE